MMVSSRFVIALLVLSACGGSPYPGFKEVASDVHLCYIKLGEGEVLPSDSDSVQVRFRIAELGADPGSFRSMQAWYSVKDLRQGAMLPVLRRWHEGDSMSVIAAAQQWPWSALAGTSFQPPNDTVLLRTELSLITLRTAARIREDRERYRLADPLGFEREIIAAYIQRSGEPWQPWGTSDLHYIIEGVATDTNRAVLKEPLLLSWEGRRLDDGTTFDVQGLDGAGFPWSPGTPDQVVQGIEVAVGLLREGQRGRFIFPSSFAFGTKGIPGAVEPSTPVVYDVRWVRAPRAS